MLRNIQARTSYLPNEILWGHHFENSATVAYDKKVRFRDKTKVKLKLMLHLSLMMI